MKRKEAFGSWVRRIYRKDDSPAGDLARSVERDLSFPRRATNRPTILRYLRKRGTPEAIAAFEVAWREYAADTLICPVCFTQYGLGGAWDVGKACRDARFADGCPGRLIALDDALRVNWHFHSARLAGWTDRAKAGAR
jgi:uncharacterized protein YozE (UPF0346 family)